MVAGAFSSSLAYGLSLIKADHLSGWRWILVCLKSDPTLSLENINLAHQKDNRRNYYMRFEHTRLLRYAIFLSRRKKHIS